jgi:ribosomal protein S18 acetylase RimI-like enzyme
MSPRVSLRPARPEDLDFCRRLYYEAMRPTIERLFGWDQGRQDETFARQWSVDEVTVIRHGEAEVGWLQTAGIDGAIFVKQIYLDPAAQNLQIGTSVLETVMAQAKRGGLAVTLGVVKGNPAQRLYERLGFAPTHEDTHKIYMRWSG